MLPLTVALVCQGGVERREFPICVTLGAGSGVRPASCRTRITSNIREWSCFAE
jgi:hypothetical protein